MAEVILIAFLVMQLKGKKSIKRPQVKNLRKTVTVVPPSSCSSDKNCITLTPPTTFAVFPMLCMRNPRSYDYIVTLFGYLGPFNLVIK